MVGTIVIPGANSSVAIPAVQHLLIRYPDYAAILTVRNTSDTDVNTKKLRDAISQYPDAKASIRQLELSDLSAVHGFASTIAAESADGTLPRLVSIVCNAYYWNLAGEVEVTGDGYEKNFQVTHLAHVALILRLLGRFGSEGGHLVLLATDAHWSGKNGLEKYPPVIPDDLELLVKPAPDKPSENFGHALSKICSLKAGGVRVDVCVKPVFREDLYQPLIFE